MNLADCPTGGRLPGVIRCFVRKGSSLTLLVLTVACAGEVSGGGGTIPEDPFVPAGADDVQIIENRRDVGRGTWKVGGDPLLEIGVTEGKGSQVLFRVTRVRRFPDGKILVVNAGTSEVRIFNLNGEHLRSFGRTGSGPGEFQDLIDAFPFEGDSVIALDRFLQRLSVFDSVGTFIRSVELMAPGSGPGRIENLLGLISPRDLLVSIPHPLPRDAGSGVQRPSVEVGTVSVETGVFRSLVSIPGLETWVEFRGDGRRYYHLPYRRWSMVSGSLNQLFVGDNQSPVIWSLSSEGEVQRAISFDPDPMMVGEVEVESYARDFAQNSPFPNPAQRRRIEEELKALPRHSFAPSFSRLTTDRAGNLWVQKYQMPGVVEPRFLVFDDSGQAKAEVTLPNGLPSTDTEALRGILDIGNDWILGVWVDEVKVEYVRMYRLDKGESPNASAGRR